MALARAKAATTADPEADRKRRHDLVPILAVWFGSKAAIGATQLPEVLLQELMNTGISRQAVELAGRITLQHPLPGRTGSGSPKPGASAARTVASHEPEVRAEYLLAAAERLDEALADGDEEKATANEERYAAQHVAAGQNRRRAAKKLDELAAESPVLRWKTIMDKNTTPDCAALNNRLFLASSPPGIPGAMHVRCRCSAEPYDSHPGLARILKGPNL